MKQSRVLIFAGIIVLMLIAAGCTSTSGPAPATPAATTVAPLSSLQAGGTPAVPGAGAASWAGSWNTFYSAANSPDVGEVLTLTQAGSAVTGSYNNGNGTISASVQGTTLSGTWADSDANGTYSGLFSFHQSADGKSFEGRWVNTAEGAGALNSTAQYWNGARA